MIYWMNFFIGGVLYVFFMGLVWSFLLEPRWSRIPRWVPCTVFTVTDIIPGIVRSLCGELSLLFHAMGFLQMAIIFLFLFCCFRSQWWKKLLAYFLYMIAAHLSEGIVLPLFELAVYPVHLCSIFSNLMDNAIRATKKCPVQQRNIVVRGATRGNYLHIKVINPVDSSDSGITKNRKGYGHAILNDIASQYNGEFQAEQAEETYTAMLSLELNTSKQAD